MAVRAAGVRLPRCRRDGLPVRRSLARARFARAPIDLRREPRRPPPIPPPEFDCAGKAGARTARRWFSPYGVRTAPARPAQASP